MWPWISIAILIVLVALLGVFFWTWKTGRLKREMEPNYDSWWIMGLMFFIIGIAMENPFMWLWGIFWAGLGLYGRKYWKGKRMTKKQQAKMRKVLIIGVLLLALLMVLGIFVLEMIMQGVI